jgi:hypothetical protein
MLEDWITQNFGTMNESARSLLEGIAILFGKARDRDAVLGKKLYLTKMGKAILQAETETAVLKILERKRVSKN